MADPLTILGAAGSIANIVEVLGKIVTTISELRNQWQDADLGVLTFETQLAALRAALIKIKEWTDTDFNDPHHQFVIDLDRCTACCRLLVSKIETEISQFQTSSNDRLDVVSKFKLLFKTKGIQDVQKMILLQTNALTLLLTACNSKTLSEQKVLLESPQTRKVFKIMENDSASMVVHRDVDSLLSYYTGTSVGSSKRSLVFDFDRELFTSRIYERWIRGSVKKSLREQQGESTASDQRKLSRAIDRDLGEHAKTLRRECRVLLLGSESKSELVKAMKINFSGYSEDELWDYRATIFRNVVDNAKNLVTAMIHFDIAPETEANLKHVETLSEFQLDLKEPISGLDPNFGEALSSLWRDPHIRALKERRAELDLDKSADYFFDQVKRISSPDFRPNQMDVLRARNGATGIQETRLAIGQLGVRMYDVNGQRSERKKWIYVFENITALMFVVDLDEYDQVLVENQDQNRIMESLTLFDSIVNSQWFTRSRIILLLNNVDVFKLKLANSPLQHYFLDYSGGNDVNKAMKYILWRFNQVNRAHLNLYPYFVQSTDLSHVSRVFAAIKEILLRAVLKDSVIF